MSALLVAAAMLGLSGVVPITASARDLLPSDAYDARIIAANRCNTAAKQGGFAPMVLDQCRAVYDETVRFERSVPEMTAAQRNTLIVAKGLSMMTLAGGYLNLDGVMSARVCQAVRTIDQTLSGYDPSAPNGLEKLHQMLANTRDGAVPKCRKGGHWPD